MADFSLPFKVEIKKYIDLYFCSCACLEDIVFRHRVTSHVFRAGWYSGST
jgi:hypothetical protein